MDCLFCQDFFEDLKVSERVQKSFGIFVLRNKCELFPTTISTPIQSVLPFNPFRNIVVILEASSSGETFPFGLYQ